MAMTKFGMIYKAIFSQISMVQTKFSKFCHPSINKLSWSSSAKNCHVGIKKVVVMVIHHLKIALGNFISTKLCSKIAMAMKFTTTLKNYHGPGKHCLQLYYVIKSLSPLYIYFNQAKTEFKEHTKKVVQIMDLTHQCGRAWRRGSWWINRRGDTQRLECGAHDVGEGEDDGGGFPRGAKWCPGLACRREDERGCLLLLLELPTESHPIRKRRSHCDDLRWSRATVAFRRVWWCLG